MQANKEAPNSCDDDDDEYQLKCCFPWTTPQQFINCTMVLLPGQPVVYVWCLFLQMGKLRLEGGKRFKSLSHGQQLGVWEFHSTPEPPDVQAEPPLRLEAAGTVSQTPKGMASPHTNI